MGRTIFALLSSRRVPRLSRNDSLGNRSWHAAVQPIPGLSLCLMLQQAIVRGRTISILAFFRILSKKIGYVCSFHHALACLLSAAELDMGSFASPFRIDMHNLQRTSLTPCVLSFL